LGKIALSSPSSLPEEQGRGRRAGDGLGPAAWEPKGGQRGGEELEGAEGFDSPTCVGPRRPVVTWPRWPRGDGRRWTRRRRCGLGEGTCGGQRDRAGRGCPILALTLGGDCSERRLDCGWRRPALELRVAVLRGLGEG